MPLSSQRNQWHVIYLVEFHDLLYQGPFEDQLVSFPGKVLYRKRLVFCH